MRPNGGKQYQKIIKTHALTKIDDSGPTGSKR